MGPVQPRQVVEILLASREVLIFVQPNRSTCLPDTFHFHHAVVSDDEAVEPTEQDRIAVRKQEKKLKPNGMKRLTIRSTVAALAKDVEHQICWPPPERIAVDPRILTLNDEFGYIYPPKIPPGLPPSRPTDHHIDLKPYSKFPASRLYRMSPKVDKELQKQLKQLPDLGFIDKLYVNP